jgi:hypothetical protein
MEVPDGAEELGTAFFADRIESLGVWRLKDGSIAIAAYHFGPSGDVLLLIKPDGTVLGYPEIKENDVDYDNEKIIAEIIKGHVVAEPRTMTEFMERFNKNGEITTWTHYGVVVNEQTGIPEFKTEIVDIYKKPEDEV